MNIHSLCQPLLAQSLKLSIFRNHFFQSRGQNGSPISSLIDANHRKRNRTFIDPVSELPRLEGLRIFQPQKFHPGNLNPIFIQPKLSILDK